MLNPADWLFGSRKQLQQSLQAIEGEKLNLKRTLEEMSQETLVLQQQLQAMEGEKLTLQHELRALRSEPPPPRDEQLAIHLTGLGERLVERINVLREAANTCLFS